MRLLCATVALAILVAFACPAWAARCGGWPATQIVFCDDFDNYCVANNPTNPWPGYPPTPDTKCATDASPDGSFFNESYHWPSFCATNLDNMTITSSNWGSDSVPFHALYPGYGTSAQYHRWDLAPTIAAKHPGYNAVNGTDENPLYLRFFFADNLVGSPPNSPLYVELALDEDRAPTDYVVMDCLNAHDCTCAGSNQDAYCNSGNCATHECEGSCSYGECNGVTCDGGPNAGAACTDDTDCSVCVGGLNDGIACSYTGDPVCRACTTGPDQGNTCYSDADCGASTCVDGPNIGLTCNTDVDCGLCVNGQVPGTACDSNYACQYHCGTEQQATCDNGPHQGTACTIDDDCAGGPVYPIVNQQWLNSTIVADHPGLSSEIHKSIAFGQLAQIDHNPCDVETGQKPTSYHACTFDGLKWTDMRSNIYGATDDFNNDGRAATYQMWIKTDTYVIWLDSKVGPDGAQVAQHSEATVPRQYLGPFNRIAMGTGPGCQLDLNGDCTTGDGCFDYPKVWGSGTGWQNYGIDNLVMLDGVPVSLVGACCKDDASCEDMEEAACLTAGGHYQGVNTTCATTTCCPYPFADADTDGDVDQDDFGALQVCFTGTGGGVPSGCECFNRSSSTPEGIDSADFGEFVNCWTGPNVLYSVALPSGCNP